MAGSLTRLPRVSGRRLFQVLASRWLGAEPCAGESSLLPRPDGRGLDMVHVKKSPVTGCPLSPCDSEILRQRCGLQGCV